MSQSDGTADSDPDLSIATDKVCFIAIKAREFDVKDLVTEPDPGSNPTDDGMIAVLEDHPDDPVLRELTDFIGGLSEDEALSLITINPAKQLAIDKRVGSIEVGKDADLTLFDKHPLSNYAKVEKVFVDGTEYFDRERDVAERAKKEADKNVLLEKEKQSEQQQRRNGPGAARRPSR